jgi:hypothetical protein
MAQIELDALETLDIQAWRTEDEDGDVTLVIKTDEGTVRVRVGRTADDADRLTEALGKARDQAAKVGDDWNDRPDRYDGYVTLSRGRWFTTFSQQSPGDQPRNGYPTSEIAIYELARMITEHGEFVSVWAEGEHGPSSRPIGADVYAHIDEHDQLRPLPGVRFEDGDLVALEGDGWPTWVVDRDYGELGVMVHTEGDPDVYALAQHDALTPVIPAGTGDPEGTCNCNEPVPDGDRCGNCGYDLNPDQLRMAALLAGNVSGKDDSIKGVTPGPGLTFETDAAHRRN